MFTLIDLAIWGWNEPH